ncbi:DUF4013 domain-containing protein [Haloarchaeobius amylolyticus]|uniref:DUF4013 domain-containing protein n=1 Tax=Haloarchaeobius amylolyticus TaxID=1198296 RepID=UPI00226DBFD5|nr:DUF4013 domain-containing protein [Haloarchaeobius amylolyticus]
MLKEALTYIRRSDDTARTLLIGTLLVMLGFLVVPLFIVSGYIVGVVRAARNDDEPPVWEDWKQLTLDGVKMTLVLLAFLVIPLLLGLTALVLAGITVDAQTGQLALESVGALAIALSVAAFVVGLVALYVSPIAVAHFAESGRMGDAFDFGEFRQAATNGTYAIAWLLAFAVNVVGGVIATGLGSLPWIGVFLGALAVFYLNVVTWYIYGQGVGLSEGLPQRPEPGELSGPAV